MEWADTDLTDLQDFKEISFASRDLFVFSVVYRCSVLPTVSSQATVGSQKWVLRVLLGNVLRVLSQVHAIWRFILCVPPPPTRITGVYYSVLVLHGLFGGKGRSQPWKCFFCGKLLEASSMPGKINWGLTLTIGMLLNQLEKLVTPLWGHIKKGKKTLLSRGGSCQGAILVQLLGGCPRMAARGHHSIRSSTGAGNGHAIAVWYELNFAC